MRAYGTVLGISSPVAREQHSIVRLKGESPNAIMATVGNGQAAGEEGGGKRSHGLHSFLLRRERFVGCLFEGVPCYT